MLDEVDVPMHSAIRIKAGSCIWFDPYDLTTETHDADIICITHAHYDHYSKDDIARVENSTTQYVFPQSMFDDVLADGFDVGRCHFVEPGGQVQIDGITITAVPAYNLESNFHPRENDWVGYIVDTGTTQYYIAGDTDATEEASQVKCTVAFVPVGGTFTMDARQAAELVNTIAPEYAVPTHYGTVAGDKEDGAEFAVLLNDGITPVLKLS